MTVINMHEHRTWGDNIYFFDWKSREVVGYMTPRPKIGDELRCKMESGKIARFEIVEIDLKDDPPDMFFATVRDLGYLDETGDLHE